MTMIQSVVPMRIGAAIDETTGDVVEAGTRIGWLLDLVTGLSRDLMQRCWQPATFAALHDGVDSLGRKLPGAGVIAVEDLRGLEARGRGRKNNNRAAQSARRHAYRALEHTAARAGLEVVMCPPRGTSALCPSCDTELARPNGYRSASCERCGIRDADRDQIAGQNIGKRVLLAKTHVKRPKNKPKRITTVEHRPVSKSRQKTTATPKQRRHKRTRHTTPLLGTTKQTHPARQASVWDRGQPTAPAESTSVQPISSTRDTAHVSASARDRQTLQQA